MKGVEFKNLEGYSQDITGKDEKAIGEQTNKVERTKLI